MTIRSKAHPASGPSDEILGQIWPNVMLLGEREVDRRKFDKDQHHEAAMEAICESLALAQLLDADLHPRQSLSFTHDDAARVIGSVRVLRRRLEDASSHFFESL